MENFKTWLLKQESSAFTRLRRDAALGLKPPIPAAAVHSRSTASPFEVKQLTKKTEASVVNHQVDSWLKSADALKKDINTLKEILKKKEKEGKKDKDKKTDVEKEPKVDNLVKEPEKPEDKKQLLVKDKNKDADKHK